MLKKFVQIFGGDPNKREIDRFSATVDQINSHEAAYEALTDDALRAKTAEFRRRLAKGESLDAILPEAFAAVREASKRTLGLRHYDVQLIGGTALHQGKIAEMRTGEGKTLVATLPIYLNALPLNPAWIEKAEKQWGKDPANWEFTPIEGISVSRGVHLITVNDYLARSRCPLDGTDLYQPGPYSGRLTNGGTHRERAKSLPGRLQSRISP